VFRLAIALLYTTGMRRGEIMRLTIGDYDPLQATLLLRNTKFHKSRLVPLSSHGIREIKRYLRVRRLQRRPMSREAPLLWNGYFGGKGYTEGAIYQGIRQLFLAAGIRRPDGQLPRVHDFRHCFAVHALLRWYRSGTDVQAKLPLLATYMGHVSIVSTEYYLRFAGSIAGLASEKFARQCGALITMESKRR
jgi:integrase